ncbi:MAG: Rrf2 family transcriptional regulator [Syntrophaceae bacterium]|nr:Rrf2 family transcriptional regulator [Syntrophaceae bacterium]
MAKREKIPRRYLQQIFQKLKRTGILDSERGPSGGYFLMKRPEEITIGEIVRILDVR